MWREKLREYNDIVSKTEVSNEAVKRVEEDIIYSNKLRLIHNIGEKLWLNEDEVNKIRNILLKSDYKVIEELYKKSNNEIFTFIAKEQNKKTNYDISKSIKIKSEENQKENKLNQDIQKIK